MTTPAEFLPTLDAGLAWMTSVLGPKPPVNDAARVLLLAIAGQESGYVYRVQQGNGPAHSFYQMERAGGITGVLTHPASEIFARRLCPPAGVIADPTQVWGLFATAYGDNLATGFARLLLWTDPHPLPAVGDEQAAFDCYVRNWRPGAISEGGERAAEARERFAGVYQAALDAVRQSGAITV